METLILDNLKSLGKTISINEFKKMINEGIKSIKYTQLVEWITKEIQILSGLEEYVNAIHSEADSGSFLLEVSSFLKEIGCPYNCLTTGNVDDRLNLIENKLILLDYLIGELRASRILNANTNSKISKMQVTLIENNTSKCLKEILMTLKFPKPPQNINSSSLFDKTFIKLQEMLRTVPSVLIGKSLVCSSYSSDQWKYINNIIELLNEEFNVRRAMLLTRLDVTVQSFKWPDRLKNKNHELEDIYQTKLNLINKLPNFSTSDFLSARNDLAILEKTSSTLVVQNTNSSINKVIIGQVPDRGGRPNEQQAPPPEMPSWQQRTQIQGVRGGQSNRGQFDSRRGRGGQQNRDNQSFRNSNTNCNQDRANVYLMTDGIQSINVGYDGKSYNQNYRQGRVQGSWNNNQSRDFQSNNFGSQSGYDNYNQNSQRGRYGNRLQSTSNDWQWNENPQNVYRNNHDQFYGDNREFGQNNSLDPNKRGYSKRGRGHNGQTYYSQSRNNY